MQMYGNFEGFPLKQCIVWVGNIMTPEGGLAILRACDLFWGW